MFPPKEIIRNGTTEILNFLRFKNSIRLSLQHGGCWSHLSGECAGTDHSLHLSELHQSYDQVYQQEETESTTENSIASCQYRASDFSNKSDNDGLGECFRSFDCEVPIDNVAFPLLELFHEPEGSWNDSDSGRETWRSWHQPPTPGSPCLLTPNPELPTGAVNLSEADMSQHADAESLLSSGEHSESSTEVNTTDRSCQMTSNYVQDSFSPVKVQLRRHTDLSSNLDIGCMLPTMSVDEIKLREQIDRLQRFFQDTQSNIRAEYQECDPLFPNVHSMGAGTQAYREALVTSCAYQDVTGHHSQHRSVTGTRAEEEGTNNKVKYK